MVPDCTNSPETRGPTVSTRLKVVVGAERLARFLDDCALRRLAAGLHREAQRYAPRVAELLDLDLAEAEGIRGLADFGYVGLARLRLQFHQGAALEIDAEVQPHREEHDNGGDR